MKYNLSMLCDYYEFTMANAMIREGIHQKTSYFDLYFRKVPDNAGFIIVSGLDLVIDYIENLKFSQEDLAYFKSQNIFSQEFLEYLENFKFECDIWAMEEGSVAFPNEPLLIIRGPAIQCQILETTLLLLINHQSLIATKANRILRAAKGRTVMEFGARRAQGPDAATYGARAAVIGGAHSTSNTLTGKMFNIPVSGTMAHSWVMMFDTEYEAFRSYALTYPDACLLLVDTYDTLKEGIPNAIKVFDEVLRPLGKRPIGIRLDSGDLAYLSKEARKMLDDAGYSDAIIVASNGLDEYKISDLLDQGAKIDSFGVGERLITSMSHPILGGVYKLVANEEDGKIVPKIKISENVEKITTPGFKNVFRFYDKITNKAEADMVCLHDEDFSQWDQIEIFHPVHTWKRKVLKNFYAEKMLIPIYRKGELCYQRPTLDLIKNRREKQIASLWEEVKRFEQAHLYIVDLSEKLWSIKNNLLHKSMF